mmetsp:Transcript_90662/g.234093  ORF Transcript_90662/g.234093 Transcript_90662/m.234093 type:complete len:248 (+) Transcript_90662:168-911(+)
MDAGPSRLPCIACAGFDVCTRLKLALDRHQLHWRRAVVRDGAEVLHRRLRQEAHILDGVRPERLCDDGSLLRGGDSESHQAIAQSRLGATDLSVLIRVVLVAVVVLPLVVEPQGLGGAREDRRQRGLEVLDEGLLHLGGGPLLVKLCEHLHGAYPRSVGWQHSVAYGVLPAQGAIRAAHHELEDDGLPMRGVLVLRAHVLLRVRGGQVRGRAVRDVHLVRRDLRGGVAEPRLPLLAPERAAAPQLHP